MTTNAKKLKIIKMVTESDESGIEKICEKLFGSSNDTNTINANSLTKRDLMEAFAHVFAEEALENPEIVVATGLVAYLTDAAAKRLNLK